jgi:intracellular multiplication protein IcmO
MRLNHFLKIEPPTDMEVRQWTNAFSSFMDRVASGVTFLPESAAGEEELVALLGSLSEQPSYTPVDIMSVALQKQVRKNDLSDFFHDMMETVETEGFHIFAPFQGDAAFESLLTISNPNFKKPLLNRADIRDHFEYVERLSGRTGQQAINVALELTADLERVTKYPPEASNLPSGDEFAARIHKIVTTIQAKAAAA